VSFGRRVGQCMSDITSNLRATSSCRTTPPFLTSFVIQLVNTSIEHPFHFQPLAPLRIPYTSREDIHRQGTTFTPIQALADTQNSTSLPALLSLFSRRIRTAIELVIQLTTSQMPYDPANLSDIRIPLVQNALRTRCNHIPEEYVNCQNLLKLC
jgi:hypothetical protein